MNNPQISGKSNSSGYRLRYVPDRDVYQIHSGAYGAFEGSLRDIWQKMYWEYEISNREVQFALDQMEKNSHNVANFGIFGIFIFTQAN